MGKPIVHRLQPLLAPAGGRRRLLLGVTLGIVVAGGLAFAQGKPDTSTLRIEPVAISAAPIVFFERNGDAAARERTRYGRLRWQGGLVLSSPSPSFGGWSGLAFDADGKTLLAVSDAGTWMTATPIYRKGRLEGLSEARIGPLKAMKDKPLVRRRDRDAEGLVLAAGTFADGTVLIPFEGHNRIGRFTVKDGAIGPPDAYLKLPPEVRKLRFDGIEAVAVLRAGPLAGATVAFAEDPLRGESDHAGWIWIGEDPQRFTLTDIGGFAVTDAVSLVDGSLLVLERRFRWNEGVKMRLRRIEAGALEPGARLSGEVLLEADMGQEIDNMEGLAVREGPNGETLITMISDDNFNTLLQRTVLLEFALEGAAADKAAGAAPPEPAVAQ